MLISNIYSRELYSSSMRSHHAQVRIPGSAPRYDRCGTIHRYLIPSYMTSSPIWYSTKSDDHVVKPRGRRWVVASVDDGNDPWLDNDGHVQLTVGLVVDGCDPWLDKDGHVQLIVVGLVVDGCDPWLVVDGRGPWLVVDGRGPWLVVDGNVKWVVVLVVDDDDQWLDDVVVLFLVVVAVVLIVGLHIDRN